MSVAGSYTVVVLGDRFPTPNRLLLLRRSPERRLAPDRWTGVGGKLIFDETPMQCALRELREETGFAGIALRPVGKLIVNGGEVTLHFFCGTAEVRKPPSCDEGRLSWIWVHRVFERRLIPATKVFMKAWSERGWDPSVPFIVLLSRDHAQGIDGEVSEVRILDGAA